MEKDITHYRNLIHKDSIILLIFEIIFLILLVTLELSVPLWLMSFIFIIMEIQIIYNKKEIKKIVGNLGLVRSFLMILIITYNDTIFALAYLLLGIISGIHSLLYLKKLKTSNINIYNENELGNKNYNLKYLTLIPILLSILLIPLFVMVNFEGFAWYKVIAFILNIINIIICFCLHCNKIKSTLSYITLIISILVVIICGGFIIDDIRFYHRQSKLKGHYNIEEYYNESLPMVQIELSLNSDTL